MSNPSLNDQPLIAHLIELRDRLIRILVVILLFFIAFIAFANDLYAYLAEPLQSLLPEGASMIATQVASPLPRPLQARSLPERLLWCPDDPLPALGIYCTGSL